MTARASIATIFLTMALVSLAGAMTALLNSQMPVEYPVWFLVSFFLLLRIKMYLDDLKDFKNARKLKWGMVLGIISWFFWVVAAANISSIQRSSQFLAVALLSATIALLYTTLVNGFEKKHIGWFVLNAAYIAFLSALWLNSTICNIWKAVILTFCIILTLADFWLSDSLSVIDALDAEELNGC